MVRLYPSDVVIYLYCLVSFIFVSFIPPQTQVGQELRVCFATKENNLWIDIL